MRYPSRPHYCKQSITKNQARKRDFLELFANCSHFNLGNIPDISTNRCMYHAGIAEFLTQSFEGNPRLNPEGFPEDPTRLPEFYNGIYEYLKTLGMEEL